MAIVLSRISKIRALMWLLRRREDDLEMPRMRRVLREHERANNLGGGGMPKSTVQSGFSSAMPQQVCKFHLMGNCNKGEGCTRRYAHPVGVPASEKARLLKEIEAKVARANERRKQKEAKQKDKGNQEKGNQ